MSLPGRTSWGGCWRVLGFLFLLAGLEGAVAQGVSVLTAEGRQHSGRVISVKEGVLSLEGFGEDAVMRFAMEDLALISPVDEQTVPLTASSVKRVKLRKGHHRFTLGFWRGTEEPKLALKYGVGGELEPVPASMLHRVPFGDAGGLRFSRGTTAPPGDWWKPGFDDSAWEEGQMPVGYGEKSVSYRTELTDMRNGYRGVFVRKPFVVENLKGVKRMGMWGRCDDGYIAWINGVEVDRYNMAEGDVAFDVNAMRSEEPIPVLRRSLPDPAAYLVEGTNLLAFHVANTSRGSSDLLLELTPARWGQGGYDDEGFRLPEDPSPILEQVDYTTYTNVPQAATLLDLVKGNRAGDGVGSGFEAGVDGLGNHSAVVFTGFLRVPADGQYTFELESVGLSQLALGDPLAVAMGGGKPLTAGTNSGGSNWVVVVKGGLELRGRVESWNESHLRMEAVVGDRGLQMEIPVDQLAEVGLVKARPALLDAEEDSPELDTVFVQVGEELQKVSGLVNGIEEDSLSFRFRDRVRRIKLDRILWVRLSRELPADSALRRFHQTAVLKSGMSLPGFWRSQNGNALVWETLWGGRIEIGREELQSISAVNGRLQYLADMKPVQVKQVPFFDRVLPYRLNRSLHGQPIRLAPPLKEGAYPRSISVHSRTALTYELRGEYQRFLSALAFQYPEGQRGEVDVRVMGDDKVLFQRKGFKAADPLELVDVSVANVTELTLEVDFGAGQDVGDEVVWADPRLVRERK